MSNFSRILVPLVVLASGCASRATVAVPGARADFSDANGQPAGSATLYQQSDGVLIRTDLRGLPAGEHGFHIHAVGQCAPPFQTAGGHFNPANRKHGSLNPEGAHAGDLPNLAVATDGSARVEMLATGVTLQSLFDVDGSALVVHATKDDYKTDPAGNAGARIACAVIRHP